MPTLEPTSATLTLTGQTPTLWPGTYVRPTGASHLLVGAVPTVVFGTVTFVFPPIALLQLTGQAPSILSGTFARPDTAVLTLTGHAPTVWPLYVRPVGAQLVLTGHDPTVWPLFVRPIGAQFAFTGKAPTVWPLFIRPAAAQPFLLVGNDPTVVPGKSISPAGAIFTLTSHLAVFGHVAMPKHALITLFGHIPLIPPIVFEELFNRIDQVGLGDQWRQIYSGSGQGTFRTDQKHARWFPEGNGARSVRNVVRSINAVHTLSVANQPGGLLRLFLGGHATNFFPVDAEPGIVQSALEQLPNMTVGDVLVKRALPVVTSALTPNSKAEGGYVIQFQGNQAGSGSVGLLGALGQNKTIMGGVTDTLAVDSSGLIDSTLVTGLEGLDLLARAGAAIGRLQTGRPAKTAANSQDIELTLGEAHQWPWPDGAYIEIIGRVNEEATTFVRAKIEKTKAVMSVVTDGVERLLSSVQLALPPRQWETWTLRVGEPVGPIADREVSLSRNGNEISYAELPLNLVLLGETYRGFGFGVGVASGATTQQVPPTIKSFIVRDNIVVNKSNKMTFTNFGTEEAWPRYLCYGPGLFKIGDGPSGATIQFGPLEKGQIALLTTHPRLRGVVDLSPSGSSAAQTQASQSFFRQLLGLATNNNTPPLLEWWESLFGIRPPQGQFYSLLKGRFTKPIPPKSPGAAPVSVTIPVRIEQGSSRSKVVGAITPRRRWPE